MYPISTSAGHKHPVFFGSQSFLYPSTCEVVIFLVSTRIFSMATNKMTNSFMTLSTMLSNKILLIVNYDSFRHRGKICILSIFAYELIRYEVVLQMKYT